MIRSITVRGLGLDETWEPSSTGASTLLRPSMAGKTRIGRALLLLLTGREPWGDAPRPRGGEPIQIEAHTATIALSRRVERVVAARGDELRMERRLVVGGQERAVASERDWQQGFADACRGWAYGDAEVVRLICWPGYWQGLTGAPGQGRALRDLLSRCLDSRQALGRIVRADPDWREGDSDTERGCEAARRSAGQRRDSAVGALESSRRALAALAPVEPVAPDALAEARATLAAGEAWGAYRAHLQAMRARDAWTRRRAELGQRPASPTAEALEAATSTAEQAIRAEREAQAAHDGGLRLVEDAERLLAEAEALDLGAEPAITDTCPTCGQPWAEAHARGEVLVAEHRERVAAHATRVVEARTRRNLAVGALQAARDIARDREMTATLVQAERSRLLDARCYSANWSEAAAALGPEPPAPPAMEQPAGVEPMPIEIQAARDTLARAARAEGASDLRQVDRDRAAAAVRAGESALRDAAEEHARLGRLLVAIRAAPAAVFPQVVAHIGDCGPIAVVGRDDGGCEVLIRGHPWREASAGELIHADLHLRAALRRAFGATWLPLIVEQAQDWSGDWPGEGTLGRGPVWYMRTGLPAEEEP